LLYGHSITKELLNLKLSSSKGKEKPRNEDDMEVDEDQDQLDEDLPDQPKSWSAETYFTNANYQAKKFVFLLFINRTSSQRGVLLVDFNLILDRLVESPRMKRAFEAAYQGVLPKGGSPFMYLRS
jgi:DNA mismatch repair protein MLH1